MFETIEVPESVVLSIHRHNLNKTSEPKECARDSECCRNNNTGNTMWECKQCNYSLCHQCV